MVGSKVVTGRFEQPFGVHSPKPVIDVQIGLPVGLLIAVPALIDTGAECSIVDPGVVPGSAAGRPISLTGVTGHGLGTVLALRMNIGWINWSGEMLVGARPSSDYPLLLGMDLLKHVRLELCVRTGLVALWEPAHP